MTKRGRVQFGWKGALALVLLCAGIQVGAARPAFSIAKKSALSDKESVVTADSIEFNNKEGVIIFDQNVKIDDEQFKLHAERLLVFLQGTNNVDQIMALGGVVITNENRSASCDKAVYTRKNGQIVMTGKARLRSGGERGGEVQGEKIVFWLNDERMEVTRGSRVILPPGTFKKVDSNLLPR